MAYKRRQWANREPRYNGRRRIAPTDGTPFEAYVSYADDPFVDGDSFNAENMNDMESRIESGLAEKANHGRAVEAYVARNIIHMPRSAFVNAAAPKLTELPSGYGEGDLVVIYDG